MSKCMAMHSKISFNHPVARENKRKRKWERKKGNKMERKLIN